MLEKLLLMSSGNLSCSSFCVLSSHCALVGAAWPPLSDDLLIDEGGAAARPPLSCLCPRLSQPSSLRAGTPAPVCLGGLLLNSLWFINVLPRLGEPKLVAVSQCGSTSAGRWGMITSLGRLAGLLLIPPRVLVALSAARARCWLLLGLLSDVSHGSFSAERPLAARDFPSWAQDSTFVLVEWHEVSVGPFLQPM